MKKKWNCLDVSILHTLAINLFEKINHQGDTDAVNKTDFKGFVHGIFLYLNGFTILHCRSPPIN